MAAVAAAATWTEVGATTIATLRGIWAKETFRFQPHASQSSATIKPTLACGQWRPRRLWEPYIGQLVSYGSPNNSTHTALLC